ncbi:MAG: FkbM family methyltransferase [Saprospiraceae bacterium]|nr:FkbM family methyltransferase [Saprospiraceae bacterium]
MDIKRVFSVPKEVLRQSRDPFMVKAAFVVAYFLYYISKHLFRFPVSTFPEMNMEVKGCQFETRKKTIDFWMCLESYETEIDDFLEHKKEMTFIDIGANIGRYSVPLGKKFKVISFEPLSSTFNQLKKNLSRNNSNAILHECGIGDIEKKIDLYYDPNEHGEASVAFKAGNKKETIQIYPLDKILEEEKNPVIKIDVEGYEYEVLKGAEQFIRNNQPVIIIEIWNDKTRDFLRDLGYSGKGDIWQKTEM